MFAVRRSVNVLRLTVLLLLGGVGLAWWVGRGIGSPPAPSRPVDPSVVDAPDYPEATDAQVQQTCGACHPTPQPDLFIRQEWPSEVVRGYNFLRESGLEIDAPPAVHVVRYYRNRAPKSLKKPSRIALGSAERFSWTPVPLVPPAEGPPAISHVRIARLGVDRDPVILACDVEAHRLLAFRAEQPEASPIVLAEGLQAPAHAEVVDLDQDGVLDILVACLGELYPTDARSGSVVWLRGQPDGTYEARTLIDQLGRTSDVQAADFDSDGDLDLVVAVFGYNRTGELLLLENRSQPGGSWEFAPRVVDPRHGAVHIGIGDLDADGSLDLAVVYGQEHECVEAYLNRGDAHFERRTIFTAPHPAFSSNGLQLADLDGDGDLDVLYTHGDALDNQRLSPDHGIHWLENRGSFPFVPHLVDHLYGIQRAVAADFDADGDLDIAATSFLPGEYYLRYRPKDLDALVVYEQTEPGQFVRHPVVLGTCDFPSCDVGDWNGDGRPDLAVAVCEIGLQPGSMLSYNRARPGVVLFRNDRRAPNAAPRSPQADAASAPNRLKPDDPRPFDRAFSTPAPVPIPAPEPLSLVN
ncbi:MAG: hypothetical protein KatS3mg108_2920 [Isosphaeraceae bacterium]|nr:MAG: hypothetical protein KatS3mg108_2920 [Isosphaeraceae bacterium]